MRTMSRATHLPAAMALNMIALMGALPIAKKHPQNILLKRLFQQHSTAQLESRIGSKLGIESHDSFWFGNYE